MNASRSDDVCTKPQISDEVWPGEQIEGLGVVRYRLRPSRYVLAVLILFSWLLINGGGAALVFALMNARQDFAVLDAFGSFVPMIVAGLIARHWSVNRWSLVVTVCEQGFEWRRWSRADHYLWDEMKLVEEFRPSLPTDDYRIHFHNSKPITLSRHDLVGHRILGQIARFEAHARGIPVERGGQLEREWSYHREDHEQSEERCEDQ